MSTHPADRTRYRLPSTADTSDEYPTRCPRCQSPVQRLSVFPGGLCLPCHAAETPALRSAAELIALWGG